jgi:hypothetical protein
MGHVDPKPMPEDAALVVQSQANHSALPEPSSGPAARWSLPVLYRLGRPIPKLHQIERLILAELYRPVIPGDKPHGVPPQLLAALAHRSDTVPAQASNGDESGSPKVG